MPSMIIVVNGKLGDGKTLLLTFFAKHFMRYMPVYTNYHVDGAMGLDVLMKIRDLGSCFIGVDDSITEGFDSYSQMGKGGKIATKILRFARKREMILGFSQQVYTGIALRVRHISNYVFDIKIIRFPVFHLKGYLPDGVCWLDKRIRFNPVVYDSYDTKEEVYQKVTLEYLNELYDLSSRNRVIFTDLLTNELALNNDVSRSIYECLNVRNYNALSRLGESWGLSIEM